MSAREELIAKYATDLKDKCGVNPNMDLLTKVTIGCGPSIYNADSATVAGSQQSELDTVKNNFLIKKSKTETSFPVAQASKHASFTRENALNQPMKPCACVCSCSSIFTT